ncbi:MAG TPA: cbb3-type cytochrome c oxidase subunit I, partial [Bryobacteraceae bacterium]|nr:cbb3-type cytochrome c oxidase subunit I [Bryobacteraceae bacterium]
FAILAGVHYWFPKFSGRMPDEKLGRWSFWLIVLGFNTTFFVQHFLGLLGMTRRIYTYPDLPWFGALNLISTIGAAILVFGILLFWANVAMSLFFGAVAGNDPWNAWTLEWAASSPPSIRNFEVAPAVRSRRPLWDQKHPEAPDWMQA